jgi:hypothetical protein
MAKLRFSITMSLDGYVAGPGQSLENPLGEGESLHEWVSATRSFRAAHGMEGGEAGVDDDHALAWTTNIGALISTSSPRASRRPSHEPPRRPAAGTSPWVAAPTRPSSTCAQG